MKSWNTAKPKKRLRCSRTFGSAPRAAPKGVQHELGIAYYRTGKLIPAEQAFARAMEEDPNDIESVQMRGLPVPSGTASGGHPVSWSG